MDDILCDAALDRLIQIIVRQAVMFIWFAPPCTSFTALQNGHPDGAWRSKEHPEGHGRAETEVGNKIWHRTLLLCALCLKYGVHFIVEHPVTSYAWALPGTQSLRSDPRVQSSIIDMCAYNVLVKEPPKKPLRLLYSAPWVPQLAQRCPGDHKHAPHLCGTKAAASAAYVPGFAHAVLKAYGDWRKL